MEDHNHRGPIKYKFLRRVMCPMGYDVDSMLKMITYTKMRRMYFRKINEYYDNDVKTYKYATAKQLSCLTGLNLGYYPDSHSRKFIKGSKNLKDFLIIPKDGSSIESLISSIKIIPKSIETIDISHSSPSKNSKMNEIESLYRNLSQCRKLKQLRQNLYFQKPYQEDSASTEITGAEYNAINKYLQRLRHLKELHCRKYREGQKSLEKYMSRDQKCPFLTNLNLGLGPLLEPNDSDKNRITPLFRFNVFPRLQELTISTSNSYSRVNFDPSISEGFKSLVQLKRLTLVLYQVYDTKFIFEGLSQLPLLDLFSLAGKGLESDEELLLIEFLQKQTNLVTLKLQIHGSMPPRERYEEQSRHLGMMCKAINSQQKLKYLQLEGNAFSLQTLSKGLSQVEMTNQLKELSITVFNDLVIPEATPQNKIKGLCDFIQRQRQFLCNLSIELSDIKDDEVVDTLIATISRLDQLESLGFTVCSSCFSNKTFPLLKNALLQLKELYYLNLEFGSFLLPYDAPIVDSSVVLSPLSSLKNLRSLYLQLPFLKQSIQERPAQALLLKQMKRLTDCEISTIEIDSNYSGREIKEVEEILSHTRQQIYFRRLLTF